MTITIDTLVTRHGKKADVNRSEAAAGSAYDRLEIGLSIEGMEQADAIGREVLHGEYDGVVVVTSDFRRAILTGEQVLRGAGMDPDKLRAQGMRYRNKTDSRMGLSGFTWTFPGSTFGLAQDQLDYHVNNVLRNYSLLTEGEEDNPTNRAVMAERASGVFSALYEGISDLSARLRNGQRGALVVVTHAPIIDGFARYFTDELQFTDTGRETPSGKQIMRVDMPTIEAHNEGQYMHGTTTVRHPGSADGVITLNIKGDTYHQPIVQLEAKAAGLEWYAFNAVQRMV